ncbi:hypothetical protein [Xylanimonas oleitrophica]|uniref:hypothetical protein n=1 Tax=Xylanimonas oleitrophica TaxID=2607479 RepID=UPI0011B691E0|nr:hypothetical protein [Xylanimonas oleitrophica]
MPEFLTDVLAKAIEGQGPDALVFIGPKGGILQQDTTCGRTFTPAVNFAGAAASTLQRALHLSPAAQNGVF